jgi:TRAP-type C4-dicarboxylate transport system permease small subunit
MVRPEDDPGGAGAGSPALRLYRRLLAVIDRTIEIAIVVIMAVMVAIVSMQVFTRYVLNSSFDWAEETSRLCFVWTMFLAMPLALKQGGHIVMEMVVTAVAPRTRDLMYRSMTLPGIVLLALVAYESVRLGLENWDETIPSLGLSGGLFFIAVAVGSAHTVAHLVDIAFTGEPRRQGIIE